MRNRANYKGSVILACPRRVISVTGNGSFHAAYG